ncbi:MULTISPECIES: DUF6319 family protein [Rhodococcus]|uniref:DUF6319 family protein n=1 Tax=Rhodococcus TaxID=1827 RepID=UPI00163A78D2|nr:MULTISPECIES: DUF6319 family protein [Rhodococcus]MBC2589562.1 translation initiation factor [Rhodococcus aetherivorans]QRI77446.1 translation initiation factor [Rhodococcus aetherivorans]QSE60865.1 translation initiation factor [Rhodococcus sp. PSBB066]QSE67827.1 translation initiation factor [Rhodococcus sp. PSBB049]
MPPRRRAGTTGPDHLTDEQLAELTTAVADGRRATVYLIEGITSLGIAPGASARAVSVAGRTVTVRPKGVDDELPFEAEELRLTKEPSKPVRKAADRSTPRPTTPRTSASQPTTSGPSRAPAPKSSSSPASTPATKETTTVPPTAPEPQTGATPKPKAASRRPKKQPGVTVTITIDPEQEWTVGVAQGTRRLSKANPVSPDAVERAVLELGDEAALEAVRSVIDAARQAAEERVAQLSRELEEARKALESLGSGPTG